MGVMATELLSFGTQGKEQIVDFKFGCSFNNSIMMMGNIGMLCSFINFYFLFFHLLFRSF